MWNLVVCVSGLVLVGAFVLRLVAGMRVLLDEFFRDVQRIRED